MKTRYNALVLAFVGGVMIAGIACNQYEYASPSPGILDVRLRVINTRTDIVPFDSTSSFLLIMRTLVATQPGDIEMEIFGELNAIRRPSNGELYNCLLREARDSVLILGRSYAPPGSFTGLEMTVTPFQSLTVFRNNIPVFIEVRMPLPAPPALQRLEPLNIEIQEGRTTRVTVTFDLDQSLVRRTEWFEYHPVFYVSSIQVF
jgi:hypothetical protein